MKAAWLLLLAAPLRAAQFPAVERSTDPITVVYPAEGAAIGPTDGEFVLGSVSDARGAFAINGQTVTVHPSGGFLAWVGVQPGTVTLSLALTLPGGTTASLERRLSVAAPLAALPPKPLAIDKDSLWPRADAELRPGDWLVARMKATPGHPARFRIGKGAWQPMAEYNPGLGLYEGALLVPAGQPLPAAPVEFELGSGWGAQKAKSPGSVSFLTQTPLVASVRGNTQQLLKTGPGEGELFPVLGGTRLLVVGRQGAESKVALSAGQIGWIESRHLEFQAPGTRPPRAVTDVVSTKATDDSTAVRVGLGDRVPFEVEEAEDMHSVTVRLHHATTHTNWVVYHSADPLVSEIRLKQETADSVLMTILLTPGTSLWGYNAAYEGTTLRLELRPAPRLAPAPASPLSGLTVFLDPGHMPSAPGALGPLGTREMDVNFAMAKAAEGLLQKQGATVVMSRRGPDDEVGLADRPRMAWDRRADLFVSIHSNQLAGGKSPFAKPHGYSVFYYHPHSLALAREIYRAFERDLPLTGEELRFGDLLVLRQTQMPAVLTESAYMTFPEQEQLLLDPRFRQTVAQGIVTGLRRFLEGVRSRQTRRKAPAVKPAESPAKAEAAAPAPPKKAEPPSKRRLRSRRRSKEPPA